MKLKIIKPILIIIALCIIAPLTYGFALAMKWFANSFMSPSQPVADRTSLIVAVLVVVIGIILFAFGMADEEEKIQRLFREMDNKKSIDDTEDNKYDYE